MSPRTASLFSARPIALVASAFAIQAYAASVPIFDGKTLAGWETRSPELWSVQDGCLTGGNGEKVKHNDFLATQKSYSNFVLKLKIKLTGDPATGLINSGIQIRTQRNPSGHEVKGYQCDYGEPKWYAGIYDEGRRNKFIAPADMEKIKPAVNLWGWNEYVIRADGKRIQTWINGVQGVDYTELDENIASDGIIAVQLHSGGNAVVQIKDVEIEELPPTPGLPTWASLASVQAQPAPSAPVAQKVMKEGNAPESHPSTPEEERAAFTVPEGFAIELVASEDIDAKIGKFVPITFDAKGRLWTTTCFEYPVDGNDNASFADALYNGKGLDKVLVYERDPATPTGYASKPKTIYDGLAIPTGVLPYKDSFYVLHGHDILKFAQPKDGALAMNPQTVLTGFGVEDSHLMPHQFTRAPGGWLWLAQGAFNRSKVRRPEDPQEKSVSFDKTRMGKFRPDGSGFEATTTGPCNIWGLVTTGEGESFIQEANDFGYPVMPFHEYANYPGCCDGLFKSYAPPFPGTAPDFRVGGTGLSGLALTDKGGVYPEAWSDVMLLANPITNKINAVKMHRAGPRWRLEQLPDFVSSSDPWFRPVAITMGPDGCVYIVDWYNRVISHNEVPRKHPDRDKVRGRIWRVRSKTIAPAAVPNFTTLSDDALIAKLGGAPTAQAHLSWQTLADRGGSDLNQKLRSIVRDHLASDAKRIQALWVLQETSGLDADLVAPLFAAENRNLRREAVRAIGSNPALLRAFTIGEKASGLAALTQETDPEVRAEVIKTYRLQLEASATANKAESLQTVGAILKYGEAPLAGPIAPATRDKKPVKVGEAYEREFQRYLVRLFLEPHTDTVDAFLKSPAAASLSVENRLLATLGLDPKQSAVAVSQLLPKLNRAPGDEEILRLAQFPDKPEIGTALGALLSGSTSRDATLEALLRLRTRLDAVKLTPFLNVAALELLNGDAAAKERGMRLATAFRLEAAEPLLLPILADASASLESKRAALGALAEIGSSQTAPLLSVLKSNPALQAEALVALCAAKSPEAPQIVLGLYPKLSAAQRVLALGKLSTTRPGAAAILAALSAKTIAAEEIDGSVLDRLQAVLGADNPELVKLVDSLGNIFRPVLQLDGSKDAWSETGITLEGPLTIEAWIRLAPGINQDDGLAGVPKALSINFYAGKLRVYAGRDFVVARKPLLAEVWTHVAVVRNGDGIWSLYIDGDLDATASNPAPGILENIRLGWVKDGKATEGAFAEYRIWNKARTSSEIQRDFDRGFGDEQPTGLVFCSSAQNGGNWGKLKPGARVGKTSDLPPILSKEEGAALDAKFDKYRALANQPGDAARGKTVANLCLACHLINGQGGQIGPNISGAGAMGKEALLRRLITPNAAMESAYHIFRVTLLDGGLREGFFVSEDAEAVVVRTPGADDQRIPRTQIASTKYLRRGIMPEGLMDGMGSEQVSDLFAYLMTLK